MSRFVVIGFGHSTIPQILVKWTLVLTLAWIAHWMIRSGHARLRLILWRAVLCFGLVLPATPFLLLPVLKIPVQTVHASGKEISDRFASIPSGLPLRRPALMPPAMSASTVTTRPSEPVSGFGFQTLTKRISRSARFLSLWALGFLWGAARLAGFHLQLHRLRGKAALPDQELREIARDLQRRLGVRRAVGLRLSDTISSPFVCGLFRPTILLPTSIAQQLPRREISALLSHEIAHLRRNDLLWCVAWQWLRTLYWFHPLVWQIPTAHTLACEQEADLIASGQSEGRGFYAQSLAQLTLRVLSLRPVETKLTLNGASQIVQRLNHLARAEIASWKWKHSLAGFGLVGTLFLATPGWEVTTIIAADVKQPADRQFKDALVIVVDEDGNPIEGATIQPDGLRVKGGHAADAYHWIPSLFGPAPRGTTDRQGKLNLRYPVVAFPEHGELTGKLIFNVVHRQFATRRIQEFDVDGSDNPIRMKHGIPLEVSGYFGPNRQPVTELVPNVSQEGARPEDWEDNGKGTLEYHKLSPGGHVVQLMGQLPSGEVVYSEGFDFIAEPGKSYNFSLEMKPGIRLEGRLDEKVPRPVKHGRVLISVRPKQFPAVLVPEEYGDLTERFGNFHFWKTYRSIAEDGSFVFESVPAGEVDVIVHGDGFISKNGGQPQNRINSKLVSGLVIGVPQAFPLRAPITKVEVATEPTATLEVTAKTESGEAIEGATVYVNPNVMRMQTGLFGIPPRASSEEPFRTPPALPPLSYSSKTDANGFACIRNVPAIDRGLEIEHPQFLVLSQKSAGTHSGHVRCSFSPGLTNQLVILLEPKAAAPIRNANKHEDGN